MVAGATTVNVFLVGECGPGRPSSTSRPPAADATSAAATSGPNISVVTGDIQDVEAAFPEPIEECGRGFLGEKGHCGIMPEWFCLPVACLHWAVGAGLLCGVWEPGHLNGGTTGHLGESTFQSFNIEELSDDTSSLDSVSATKSECRLLCPDPDEFQHRGAL